MATRPLSNAEVLPALEPFELELLQERTQHHARTRSWARGALLLDAVLLVAAGAATQLGATDAGILPLATVWLVLYGGLVLGLLYLRRLFPPRPRPSGRADPRGAPAGNAPAPRARPPPPAP